MGFLDPQPQITTTPIRRPRPARWRQQVGFLARLRHSQRRACLEHRQQHKHRQAVGYLAVRRQPLRSNRNKGRQHQLPVVSLVMRRRSPNLLAVYSGAPLRNPRQTQQTQASLAVVLQRRSSLLRQAPGSLAAALQRRSSLLRQALGSLAIHSKQRLLQVPLHLASHKQSHLADFCKYHLRLGDASSPLTSSVAKVSSQRK